MSDDNASGNRWEPDTTPAPTTGPITPAEPTTSEEPAAATSAPGRLRDRARSLRGNRAAQAGGVVAVLLAVGAAGFGAGWAASPESDGSGRTGPDGHHGFPGDSPDDMADDGDGRPPLPPGQQPDGTQPGTGSGTDSGLTQSSWYVVPSGTGLTST